MSLLLDLLLIAAGPALMALIGLALTRVGGVPTPVPAEPPLAEVIPLPLARRAVEDVAADRLAVEVLGDR